MFSWNIWACLHVSMAICFPWIRSRENTGMHIHLIASQSVVKVMGMYNFHVNIFTNEPHLSLIFCYNSSQKCCLLINDPWRKSHSNHHHRVISSALWSGWSEGGNRRVQAVSHRCENAMQQYGKLAYVLSAWQLCTPGPVWITRGAFLPNPSLLLLFARYTSRSDFGHLHPSSPWTTNAPLHDQLVA